MSNAGEERDLHKRMFGLEETIKLIMAAIKIWGVNNTKSANENIRALVEASNVKNPSMEIAHTETHNECLQHEFKENEVIVDTQIVDRVE